MNLAQIIEPHDAGATALRFGGEGITYGELRSRCAAVRRSLSSRGVKVGDRVALCLGATPDFVVCYFAILGAGAVAVPLNPSSPPAEIDRELEAVRASFVVSGGLAPDLEALGHEVVAPGDLIGEALGDEAPPIVERAPEDQAALLFTSGTAGSPKAAVLTHGSLLANIEQIELRVGLAATAEDVGMLAVPPFHILGLNAVLGVQLYAGGCLVLLERFDPAETLRTIAAEKVSILAGVPQLFAALADAPGVTGDELHTVRLACSGAAPLPAATAANFERRFGVPIWQGYGLTEASPTVTFPDLSGARQVSSVGVPLPGVEVRVVDADGADVEPGDPGEILVRGPNVFSGYFEDSEATTSALDKRGWLHTGDVAVMSEDGSISIVDRQKDLVIVSGFNVFPAEVEHVLEMHPGVLDAAVIGVPDDEQGESVRAFVVPEPSRWPEGSEQPDSLSPEILLAHCSAHLARYKCPSTVTFVRELPRGLQGKVLRRAVS